MKTVFLFLLIILFSTGYLYSQNPNIENTKLDYNSHTFPLDSFLSSSFKFSESDFQESSYTVENALLDIEQNTLKIVIQSGTTGFGGMGKYKSSAFQKKYNVTFCYLGCIRSRNEDTHGYNQKIMNYLASRYGEVVRAEFVWIWGDNEFD